MDKSFNNWLSIESAPKDGTRVLLWDGSVATEAYFESEEREREDYVKTDKDGNEIFKRVKYTDGWWCPANEGCSYSFNYWMPMPNGPEMSNG